MHLPKKHFVSKFTKKMSLFLNFGFKKFPHLTLFRLNFEILEEKKKEKFQIFFQCIFQRKNFT